MWLRTNNTCPVCRHVFFPAQQGTHLERDQREEEDLDSDSEADREPIDVDRLTNGLTASIESLCFLFCQDLNLSDAAMEVAAQMAEQLDLTVDLENHTPRLVLSTTLYIVTHIIDQHRSLEQISELSGIRAEDIRQAYILVRPAREVFIQHDMLGVLRGGSLQDFLELLPAPTTENGFLDYEGGWFENEHHLISAHSKQPEQLCDRYSDELDYFGEVRDICRQLAGQLQAVIFRDFFSPLPAVAVSLYIASHLVSLGTPIGQISQVVGIRDGLIEKCYRSFHPYRRDFINSDMLEKYAVSRRNRVLRAVAWPPL